MVLFQSQVDGLIYGLQLATPFLVQMKHFGYHGQLLINWYGVVSIDGFPGLGIIIKNLCKFPSKDNNKAVSHYSECCSEESF